MTARDLFTDQELMDRLLADRPDRRERLLVLACFRNAIFSTVDGYERVALRDPTLIRAFREAKDLISQFRTLPLSEFQTKATTILRVVHSRVIEAQRES